VALYKQTILGPLWIIIQPLVTTLVFTVIFGNLAKISTDGMPKTLFYMSGVMMWTYFHNCTQNVGTSLIGNAPLFRKVYYPRLVSPLSLVISNLAQLGLNLLVFLSFYFYYLFFTSTAIHPTWWLLAMPLLVIESAMIGMGVGLCIAAMTIKYRDLTFAIPFITQLWMYATPIVYPTSLLSERWRWLLMFNPMASVVEQCRMAFLGTGTLTTAYVLSGWGLAFLLLVVGIIVFQRAQRTFVDTI
jgi:lipopolysaccharide transport system permease protein